LSRLIRDSWQAYAQVETEPFLVKPSVPVLFFGDSSRYFASKLKIITVGLNPSRTEFPEEDRFLRFSGARCVYPDILGGREYDAYLEALNEYFRNRPYNWFGCFEDVLAGLDCSYYGKAPNVALHTDLCSPLATDPTWKDLLPEVQNRLIGSGSKLWHDLVEWLAPDLILASVARSHIERIRFSREGDWQIIHTVARTNPYYVEISQLKVAEGRVTTLVFGKAAQKPFGTVSNIDKRKIGVALREVLILRA
jgi:hypothetical protein